MLLVVADEVAEAVLEFVESHPLREGRYWRSDALGTLGPIDSADGDMDELKALFSWASAECMLASLLDAAALTNEYHSNLAEAAADLVREGKPLSTDDELLENTAGVLREMQLAMVGYIMQNVPSSHKDSDFEDDMEWALSVSVDLMKFYEPLPGSPVQRTEYQRRYERALYLATTGVLPTEE